MPALLDCIPCLCDKTLKAVRAADLQSLIATGTGHSVPPFTEDTRCPHAA